MRKYQCNLGNTATPAIISDDIESNELDRLSPLLALIK